MSRRGTATSPEETAALVDSVRGALARAGGSAGMRAAQVAPGRTDRKLWQTLCREIGVAALAIPEEFGGAGATFGETAAVLEALGGTLHPVPMLSCAVLATGTLLLAGDDAQCAALLPAIAAGERIATVCWAGPTGWDRPGVHAEAGLLTGAADYVLDGEIADLFLVLAARTGPADTRDVGVTLHIVDADTPGVTVTALPVLDPTRGLARVRFDEVPATSVAAPDDLGDRLRDLGWALLSAEQTGGAARALELTVEHTRSRNQFGRPLASFQALKHAMADMYVLVESMRSLSFAAIDALVRATPDAADLAAAAHAYCSESYAEVTGQAVHLHGGLGITWEHDIGLYFKRARADAQLFGSAQRALSARPL